MPINIDMGDDWVLTSDSSQYTLNKRRSKKGGDIYLSAEGHFYTLESALKGYCEIRIKASRSKSFEDLAAQVAKYTKEIKAIGDTFREALKTYKPEEEVCCDTVED